MAVYLITWDLNREGDAYRRASIALHDAFDKFTDSIRDPDLDSVRFVSTVWTASRLKEYLKPQFLDDNDTLFITRIHATDKDWWLSSKVADWLKARL